MARAIDEGEARMSTILLSFALTVLSADVVEAKKEHNFTKVAPIVPPSELKNIPDLWVLEFQYRDPRFIVVELPGEGRQLLWYMTYRVMNTSDKPRLFLPRFTIVTDAGKVYQDTIIPRAERAITAKEDPVRRLTQPYQNSVTMSAAPIEPSKAESLPIVHYGVAIWKDVDMKAKSFSVFVEGLSNGYVAVEDPKTKTKQIKKKTLKLEFAKPGDVLYPTSTEIRLMREPVWTYR
jgi:hypothetical protein